MKKLLCAFFLFLAQFAFGATAVLVDSTTTNVIQPATTLKIPSGMTFTANSGSTVNFAAATSILGTPSSLGLANATGLPIATGVTGLGTGVGSFLTTPTFSNLSSAVTGATLFASTTKADVLDAAFFAADAGSTDAYVVTLSPAITGYVTGVHYRFKANTANTGAASINFNSLGAKTIVKVAGGIATTLADNDILAGQWVELVYDGTNMQMQSMLGNASGGGSGSPGGSNTQVQYNNSGSFGGISGATSNGTTMTLVAPILGTPASVTLTNGTGLPISTGVSGLGSGVATFLATPSSANLQTALTDATTSNFQFGRLGLGVAVTGTHVLDIQRSSTGTTAGFGDLAGSGPTFYFGITASTSIDLLSRNNHPIRFQQQTTGTGLTLNADSTVTANLSTTSTSTSTGALIVVGGLGVGENINAGGNIVTQTVGKTLAVKSGSNSKAGTFTLSSGAATLSNSSITANSVLVCWLKTASGAITAAPYATGVSVGTSFTIAGGAGDNSTYNYVILEVN